MGTRHFDIENRIEPKNETKRNANIRRFVTGGRMGRVGRVDGWDGNQKCPLLFF